VLDVPPLRDRQEDVPVLVEHVLALLNDRYGLGVRAATREALRPLAQHA
jgi:DNA-binding NtrC family response regulator